MEDDLFQSLGGSLMKDLLADLQGDDGEGDGWLSLEQLEQELSQLDNAAPAPASTLGSLPLPPLPSAASMVVSGQQQFQQQQQQQQPIQGVGLLGPTTVTTAPADAWKESLQKFTALSLDQDFLAADTVRKQQMNQQPPAAPQLPPGFMAEAEDYDEQEKATLKPPPGMASGPPPGIATVKAKSNDDKALLAAVSAVVPPIPKGTSFPTTPANSMVLDAGTQQKGKAPPKTPRNSVVVRSADAAQKKAATSNLQGVEEDIPMAGKVTILQKETKEKVPPKTPRNSVVVPGQDAAATVQQQQMQQRPPQGVPPQGVPPHMGMPHQMGMHPQHMHGMPPPHMHGMPPHGMPMPPPQMQGMPPPHMMGTAVPVAMPTRGGPAWQTGPRPPAPSQPPTRVFCNPHPNAPPIPAQVLESGLMKSRDITYIVHSILKPVLMAGFSEHDYDIQLLHRQNGGRPAGPRPLMMKKKPQNGDGGEDAAVDDVIQQEMASREKKSKEWSTKNTTLGHVAKSNVARPRALIASPALSQSNQDKSESASEQKQRARLWKARIYCDQAYQAYLAVVDVWAKAAPGSVPKEVHAPLIRLMKCLGISPINSSNSEESTSPGGGDFRVDPEVLQLFLKLSKGRILFSRIVEQALLPPSAVQTVLPSTLDTLYKTPLPSNDKNQDSSNVHVGDLTDDRCFRALTVVIQTLPALSGECILKCAEMMKSNSEAALSSTCRMECLHALLQRGSGLAGSSDPSLVDYPKQWKEQENNFMAILSGM